jgi:hypothetical protein
LAGVSYRFREKTEEVGEILPEKKKVFTEKVTEKELPGEELPETQPITKKEEPIEEKTTRIEIEDETENKIKEALRRKKEKEEKETEKIRERVKELLASIKPVTPFPPSEENEEPEGAQEPEEAQEPEKIKPAPSPFAPDQGTKKHRPPPTKPQTVEEPLSETLIPKPSFKKPRPFEKILIRGLIIILLLLIALLLYWYFIWR